MYEVAKELQGILGEKPATSEELSMAVASQTLTLPGSWETANAVASSIAQIVRFGLDDQYFETYADNVRGLKLRQIQSAAANVIYPDKLVWVVVGDREKIEAGIRELGLGPMYEIDADGNVKGEVGTR